MIRKDSLVGRCLPLSHAASVLWSTPSFLAIFRCESVTAIRQDQRRVPKRNDRIRARQMRMGCLLPVSQSRTLVQSTPRSFATPRWVIPKA